MAAGIPAALQQLAKAGVWTIGLDPAGPADLWQTPLLDAPIALVLGAEGNGLSRLVRQRCDVWRASLKAERSDRSMWPQPGPWPASR